MAGLTRKVIVLETQDIVLTSKRPAQFEPRAPILAGSPHMEGLRDALRTALDGDA